MPLDRRCSTGASALAGPGAVFAADAAAFEAALDALPGIPAVVSAGHRDEAEQLSVLMNTNPAEAVRTAFASRSPTLGWLNAAEARLASPASLDAGEITDKGYINQRRVLARRADLVDMLYADPVPAGVVVAERTS